MAHPHWDLLDCRIDIVLLKRKPVMSLLHKVCAGLRSTEEGKHDGAEAVLELWLLTLSAR